MTQLVVTNNIQDYIVCNKQSTTKTKSSRFMSFWLYIQVIYVCLYGGIRDLLNLPNGISYVIDLLNVVSLIYLLISKKRNKVFKYLKINSIFISFFVIIICCSFTAFFNIVNPLLYMWSCRNFFRIFIFFFSLIVFCNKKALKKIEDFLMLLMIPNFIVSIIQFLFFNINQDNLGGIFGTTTGVNGFTNVYLCITITLVVIKYLNKKTSLMKLLLVIGSWIVIIALAELKVAFVEIPLIVLFSIFLSKNNYRAFGLAVICFVGLIVGVNLIVIIFPQWSSAFASIESLINVGLQKGGGYNISRLNAYYDINQMIFRGDVFKNLFGLGFGNCEYSSFSFLVSNFYKIYGFLNYRWFTNQFLFLQCGYLGIASYGVFIFLVILWNYKQYRNIKKKNWIYAFGIVYSLMMIINFFYNASFNTEIGYLAMAGASLPFIYNKVNREVNNDINK